MQTPAFFRRPGLFGFGLGATLLLASCGGAPTELSTGGRLRASTVQPDSAAVLNTETCRLLTPREVASLTGRPVRQQSQGAACMFVEDSGGASAEAVVQVSFRPAAAFRVVQAGNDLKRRDVLPVTGLGHEAYYDDDHGDLYVQLPGRTLVIGMPRPIRERPRHRLAPELGRLAVARLAAAAPEEASDLIRPAQ
ncbi:hypothetical protein Q5H93_20710 [Hymenobacter sp. ASUV-10]|uniref:DUF3558 domain-containing protein n=1 Tax=Hymenobacter aranciens TaxID=3063996 RepID=A0ABT9BHA8_9BACT|nr:hypothetical protein [Hymenobacter sp. ASUV-10]MDO7877180.1 hypothetical protein [Hymenobacter sp. ASUV-10]